MTSILVSGGAGFIGSTFVNMCQEIGEINRILVLDKLTYAGDRRNLKYLGVPNSKVEFFEGDVCDGVLVENLVQQVDTIVHFAAETHVTRSLSDSRNFINTDIVGTHNLLMSIVRNKKSVEKFIHISTSEVYGSAIEASMNEKHALNPASPYAAAKAAADRLVYSFFRSYEIPALILRPFNNYGPMQHLEKFIPRVITSSILNEPIKLHGSGLAMRDFIFVTDTVKIILNALRGWDRFTLGDAYNIGSGVSRSIQEIANQILDLIPASSSAVMKIEDRPGQVERHTANTDKIRSVLGDLELSDWNYGLSSTISWYQENQDWWTPKLNAREIAIEDMRGKTVHH